MIQKKRVLCAGTFDHFHLGHQFYLWTALTPDSQLTIIVARDATVKRLKGFLPDQGETERLARLEAEFKGFPVRVRLGRADQDFLKTVQEENPDIIRLGYDQRISETFLKNAFPKIDIERAEAFAPEFFKSRYFRATEK